MADQTTAPAAAAPAASAANKVIKYTGLRADFVGPKGSHKEVTKAQLKEAGVADPFTDSSQDVVVWAPNNAYQVPRSVFTEAAVARLLKEDDLEEATAE